MQTAKNVYPDYQDEVAFIAVGVDPSESEDKIISYAERQGYPWEMAVHHGDVMSTFGIRSQPSKVFIDGDGVITLRQLSRTMGEGNWREALDAVTA